LIATIEGVMSVMWSATQRTDDVLVPEISERWPPAGQSTDFAFDKLAWIGKPSVLRMDMLAGLARITRVTVSSSSGSRHDSNNNHSDIREEDVCFLYGGITRTLALPSTVDYDWPYVAPLVLEVTAAGMYPQLDVLLYNASTQRFLPASPRDAAQSPSRSFSVPPRFVMAMVGLQQPGESPSPPTSTPDDGHHNDDDAEQSAPDSRPSTAVVAAAVVVLVIVVSVVVVSVVLWQKRRQRRNDSPSAPNSRQPAPTELYTALRG